MIEAPAPDDATLASLPRRPDRYVPIGDYAAIGDTRSLALVSRDGAVDWLCLPDMPDESMFAAVLDAERGGTFFVGPADPGTTSRRYTPGTAVLVTRHETPSGTFELTDFMPIQADGEARDLAPARRVVRRLEVIGGAPRVAVRYAPRPGYGARLPAFRRVGADGWAVADGRDFLLLQSDVPLREAARGTLVGSAVLEAGRTYRWCLSFERGGVGVVPPRGDACAGALEETCAWWGDFGERVRHEGPFGHAVVRSMITLRLLTYSLSGAVLAAPTTSLPEAIGAARNYDYRYCWLRDASFVLKAYVDVGLAAEAEAFFRWLMHATRLSAPELRTFYTVYGRTDVGLAEQRTLEGYRGSAPVQLGNAAMSQLQLDAYGSMLSAALAFHGGGGRIDAGEAARLHGFARVVCRQWSLPDDGLWEMPGPRRHNTYSKAMCWNALEAFVRLVERGAIAADAAPYRRERDAVRSSVLAHGWNGSRGAYTGAYGQGWLDASVLLLPRLGIVEADEPRMRATFERVVDELGHGVQVRRYADGVDGIDSTEGTFTACGYWAADCLARRGDVDEACRRVEGLLGHANDVGLMSEEIDPDSGELLGNFPQAFSHAGLVGAATVIGAAMDARRMGGGGASAARRDGSTGRERTTGAGTRGR